MINKYEKNKFYNEEQVEAKPLTERLKEENLAQLEKREEDNAIMWGFVLGFILFIILFIFIIVFTV